MGVPPLATSDSSIDSVIEILKKRTNKKKIIDLGCARGKVVRAVKKEFPDSEVIGYEKWPVEFIMAKIVSIFSKVKPKILYKNFFYADLSDADVIYCFLIEKLMPKVEAKFNKELKPGTLVISNSFPLPGQKLQEVIDSRENNKTKIGYLYIYIK